MKTSSVRRFKVLGLLAIPLLAVAVAVFVLAWGHSTSTQVAADTPHAGLDFSMQVKDAGGTPVSGCDTKAADDTKCDLPMGQTFQVQFQLNAIDFDYKAFQVHALYSGVTSKDDEDADVWPDCAFEAIPSPRIPGEIKVGCAIGIGAPLSSYTGTVATVSFNCTADESSGNTITMIHGTVTDTLATDGSDVEHAEHTAGTADETLTINCVPPPTPTPTPTPPPVPAMEKDPALSNLWLTQNAGKLPPTLCEEGGDVAVLTEQLSQEIVTTLPAGFGKDPNEVQELAAFQFEVNFDPDLVCVDIDEANGVGEGAENMSCTTVTAKGMVRIGCFTQKQTDDQGNSYIPTPDTSTPEGRILARVSVRPQPELYSQIIANQANGIPVQIQNVGCQLNDKYGHDIPIFSCDDADITIRFLEGDVVPDCTVDNTDEQALAFRWGAEKGNLLYNERFDLVPSGQVSGDGYIHIGDLQFVFGRHNSSCDDPNPPQPPVNPKEKNPT